MTDMPTLAEALQEAKATIDGNPLHLTRHLQVLVLRVEELPEWRCPACGAVTRARMADAAPDAEG